MKSTTSTKNTLKIALAHTFVVTFQSSLLRFKARCVLAVETSGGEEFHER